MPRARGMAVYVRDGYGAFRQPKFECGCCEMLFFRVCGERQNLYVYSLCRNPDLDDRIFDCLLASIAAVQAEDARASFLFVGDLNGHHQECPLTSQQSLVAISWLSAQPTHVVEHLTSWGRIIKTLVKLQCSVPCISSYNMKATMCQQRCKSGSSKIYKFIVGRLYVLLRRAHLASTSLLTTCNSQSENVLQTI